LRKTRILSANIRKPITLTANYDALDEVIAADVLTPNMIASMPRGLAGAKLVHQKTVTGMPDYHTAIEDLIAEGDKVVARVKITGTHIDLSGIYIVRIADGKIVEHWGEENGSEVLRQLGFKIKLEPAEG
jgi:predicted ester cyclase